MATEDSPDDVAAHWVARLDRRPLTEQEQHALQDWLQADIRHKGAFLRSQAIWQAADRAKAFYTPTRALPYSTRQPNRRAFVSSAVAASLCALFVPGKTGEASTRYATSKNILLCPKTKEKQLILDCYSQAEERSDSTRIIFGRAFVSGTERVINTTTLKFVLNGSLLLSRGANYESGIVTSGTAWVKGYGLSEHKTLSSGEEITLTPQGKLHFSYLDPETLSRLTAWTKGQVSLDTETISEAADIFNRYNQKQLVPSFRLADFRLSGMFDLNRPDIFAMAVKTVLHAAIHEDASHIYLE